MNKYIYIDELRYIERGEIERGSKKRADLG